MPLANSKVDSVGIQSKLEAGCDTNTPDALVFQMNVNFPTSNSGQVRTYVLNRLTLQRFLKRAVWNFRCVWPLVLSRDIQSQSLRLCLAP